MDQQYWDEYYEKRLPPEEPSRFARDIAPELAAGSLLLDLGCGNGRDALFFHQKGLRVVGIDQSSTAIAMLSRQTVGEELRFVQGDFVTSEELSRERFDHIYSRFTLHSVSEEDEPVLLDRLCLALAPGGSLWIEARGIHDALFGRGEAAGRNAFVYQGHYRRFLILEEVTRALGARGLEIVSAAERDNCAVYREENPMVIRIHGRKGAGG